MLRILQSFMIDPGRPPRTGTALREHLRRWIAPVLDSQMAGAQTFKGAKPFKGTKPFKGVV
jgi:hypothetical protein